MCHHVTMPLILFSLVPLTKGCLPPLRPSFCSTSAVMAGGIPQTDTRKSSLYFLQQMNKCCFYFTPRTYCWSTASIFIELGWLTWCINQGRYSLQSEGLSDYLAQAANSTLLQQAGGTTSRLMSFTGGGGRGGGAGGGGSSPGFNPAVYHWSSILYILKYSTKVYHRSSV